MKWMRSVKTGRSISAARYASAALILRARVNDEVASGV